MIIYGTTETEPAVPTSIFQLDGVAIAFTKSDNNTSTTVPRHEPDTNETGTTNLVTSAVISHAQTCHMQASNSCLTVGLPKTAQSNQPFKSKPSCHRMPTEEG